MTAKEKIWINIIPSAAKRFVNWAILLANQGWFNDVMLIKVIQIRDNCHTLVYLKIL